VAILMAGARGLDNFEITPLVAEDVYLAGPRSAGLRLDKPVPLRKLAELPVILFSKRNQLRVAVENALAHDKLALRPYLEVEGQPLTLDLVKNGTGYTVMPYCAVQTEIAAGEISGAPIRGLQTTWALAVNRARAHAPALRELIALIRKAVDEHVKSGTWRAAPAPKERRQEQSIRSSPRKRGRRTGFPLARE
ncbi:MAG TPA: LysR substrate-binding domain-containing protein, partial [Pseudolabrys sp.]|nr:LysR substrate-binding domain-containing protein [Pseudolabrys sp.]